MDQVSRALLAVGGGVAPEFEPIPDSTVVIPIITNNASNSYLFLIGTNGTILGRIRFASKLTSSRNINYQRHQGSLYLLVSGTSVIYRCNLSSFTMTTVAIPPAGTDVDRTPWARISASQLLQVDTANSTYKVLDMAAGTVTSTPSYPGSTDSAFISSQGLVSFYSRSSAGLSSFGSRVYWYATNSNSATQGEINVASVSGSSLGARTVVVSSTGNYSRQWGAIGNTTTAMLQNFVGIYKVLGGSDSATLWNLAAPSITYGGQSYNRSDYGSPVVPECLNSNLRMYQAFSRYDSPTSSYQFVLGTYDFSAASGTQTPAFLMTIPANTSTGAASTTIIQTGGSGQISVLHQDPATSNSTFKLWPVDGTTVGSAITVDVTSAYSTELASFCSNPVSEMGVYAA